MQAALLLLADGRFPDGAHAHSGGIEAAVAAERVHDIASLRSFLSGRLHTLGLASAAFAAVACADHLGDDGRWAMLDAEADARTPSSAQRSASRALGRQLVRAGRSVWPSQRLDALVRAVPAGPHHAIAIGAVATAAGLGPPEAALAAAHAAVNGPATAAVRLLGLDPVGVSALVARLADDIEAVARHAVRYVDQPPAELPCDSAPRIDVDAEIHASWGVRLFAS